MPKVKRSRGRGGGGAGGAGGGVVPGVALADQILQADTFRDRGRVKIRDSREENEDKYVDERLSRKILQQARIQQEELQSEYGVEPEKKKIPVTVLGKYSHQLSAAAWSMWLLNLCTRSTKLTEM